MVKNLPAIAGDARDVALIHWSGRSPGEGNGTDSHVLAWISPCPEDPGGLQSMGSQESDMTAYACTHSPLCGTNGDQRSKM